MVGVGIVEGAVVSGLMEDRSKPLHEVLKGLNPFIMQYDG